MSLGARRPAGRGRRRRVRIWALGLLPLAVLVAVVAGLRIGSAVGGRLDRSRPGPVLLVSGYGGSTGSLEALASRLRSAGRQVIVVPPVGDNTGDLSAQAAALQDVVSAQVAAGAPSVDVVGYSAGGVVARIWASELGGTAVARRIVTLGSPHHGTDVAGLAAGVFPAACPTACQQLAPGSDLLSGLPQAPSGPAWISIWTADDDVVVPADSAVLPGALNLELQQVCPSDRVAHSGLPTDALTIGLVELALDGPALGAVPPPSRCAPLRAAGSAG